MEEKKPPLDRRQADQNLARLVGEAGVKLASLEDARTEMKGLKESVVILAEAIGHTVTAEEAEMAMRHSRFQLFWGSLLTLVILGVLGGFLLHGQHLQRQGIRCSVLQGYQAAANNQASHDTVFRQFHIPIPDHPVLPIPTPEELAKACRPFLPRGQ